MHTEGVKLKRCIEKHVKSHEKLANISASIDILNNNSEEGPRYPAGMKPFKAPEHDTSYDETLKAAVGRPATFTISVPRDTSKRLAMMAIHRQAASLIKAVEKETLEEVVQVRSHEITLAAFINSCSQVEDPVEREARDKKYPPEIPGPLPAIPTANVELCLKEVKALYSKMLMEVVDKWQKKTDEPAAADVDNAVISSDPVQLPTSVIKMIVDEKVDKEKQSSSSGHRHRTCSDGRRQL